MTAGLRAAIAGVGLFASVAVVGVDGNARGPAAIAATLALHGARAEAAVWMARARPSLARFGASIVEGRLTSRTGDGRGLERALKFAVRDDAARAWWSAHTAASAVNPTGDASR
jgi:hypothetical protein